VIEMGYKQCKSNVYKSLSCSGCGYASLENRNLYALSYSPQTPYEKAFSVGSKKMFPRRDFY